ncbi:YraN family protein [Robiginitalea sediminis]|uniref:YraN family protein n=1 Tax=Robiginitalea sediminis TaxID=1982593 RepID=UPI001303AF35|nr:YraN family protein [Robiginitalea sediminis]
METTTSFGSKGEALAAAFLQQKGYRILHRNYRYRKAEVDLVASCGTILVIVEVKTRTVRFYESLAESIPRSKIRRLVAVADHLVASMGWHGEVRFDVIQVLRTGHGYDLVHLESAFYHF